MMKTPATPYRAVLSPNATFKLFGRFVAQGRPRFFVAAVLGLAGLASCSAPEEIAPFLVTPEADELRLLQVDLVEAGGALRLVGHRQVDMPAAYAPARSSGGDYLAVAFDGAAAVDSTWVNFTRFSLEHGDNGESDALVIDEPIADPEVTISFLADRPISEIRIFGLNDQELLSFDPNVVAIAHAAAAAPDYVQEFEEQHPGVRLWVPGVNGAPQTYQGRTISTPTEEQTEKLQSAFDAMPASLQGAISVLMVGSWVSSVGAGGQTFGYRVMFNQAPLDANEQEVVSARMHHEAVHALTNLLDSRGGIDSEVSSTFLASARNELSVIGEFHETWCELQNVAISAGLAKPYRAHRGDKTDLCQTNGQRVGNELQTRAAGFSGRYGQTFPREDMADFAAKVEWGNARGGYPTQCALLAGGEVADEPLVYAKLRLLADYHMVSDALLHQCLGASMNEPDTEGIALDDTIYTTDLIAGQALVGTHDRAVIIADGGDGSICNLSTPGNVQSGTFRIDAANDQTVANRASLRVDQADSNVTYDGGLIFVDDTDSRTYQGRVILAGVKTGRKTYEKSSIVISGSFKSTDFLRD